MQDPLIPGPPHPPRLPRHPERSRRRLPPGARAARSRAPRDDQSLAERRLHLLACFYEPHHAALTRAVDRALAAHATCLVLDGHSFPTRPLPYEDDQNPDRADICIGTDASHTPAWLRDAAAAAFEALGYRVAIDRPFAGALVPMRYCGKDLRVRALMIEVRRGLYTDERSGARGPAFAEVRERLGGALRAIAGAGSRANPVGGDNHQTGTKVL